MREPQAYDREGMPLYPDWQRGGTLYKDDDGKPEYDWAECGTCGRRWNDALVTGITPAPSGRCPFEYDHEADDDDDEPAARLEYLRTELRAERISWGELAELQSLAAFIDPADTELLEAAGVPEYPEDASCGDGGPFDTERGKHEVGES